MTKVRFHGPIAGFSGAMGEMVFADNKSKNRTTAYMKSHVPPTEAQLDQQAYFRDASALATAALADPAKKAFYAEIAEKRNSNPYAVALTDHLVHPEILPLELGNYRGHVGDTIQIIAKDDIGLADVEVTLNAMDGSQIETGKAVEAGLHTGIWTYVATTSVALESDIFIKVVGTDHAGLKAQLTENPIVGRPD